VLGLGAGVTIARNGEAAKTLPKSLGGRAKSFDCALFATCREKATERQNPES
jgi:hypothetical protein